jgi:hypothetical protein
MFRYFGYRGTGLNIADEKMKVVNEKLVTVVTDK